MWASGARLEGTCGATIKSADWKESRDGSGGWLATGCSDGTVGVSWISHPAGYGEEKEESGETIREDGCAVPCKGGGSLYRSHFILSRHIGEVNLVRWMSMGARLASYDCWGHIFLWNNRAHILAYDFQIDAAIVLTDIQWSPCGDFLIVCGKSGNIMMFCSGTGMPLLSVCVESTACGFKKANFTCCSWDQSGTRVALGTGSGEVVFIDPTSGEIAIKIINLGVPIQFIGWREPEASCQRPNSTTYLDQGISVYLRNGDFAFYPSPDSEECSYDKTNVVNGLVAWNSTQSALVVLGYSEKFLPVASFLDHLCHKTFTVLEDLPGRSKFPLRNVLWALQDSVVLFSCGSHIYSLTVDYSLPSLESLCRYTIVSKLIGEENGLSVDLLPLPKHIIGQLSRHKEPLVPTLFDTGKTDILYEPVSKNHRLHCILKSTGCNPNDTFVLKLEHLSAYVPLLLARRKPSKLASIQTGFFVEPAFEWSQLECQDREEWTRNSPSRRSPRVPTRYTARQSFLRRMLSALTPTHNQRVMDPTHTSGATAIVDSTQEKLIMAEVDGNNLMNHFRFRTNSPLFQNGSLGSLNIHSNYIKSKPRIFTLVMSRAGEKVKKSFLSKEPEWNDNFRIYELDFGGRVARDSIKNFQIEHNGEVVLQFGKVNAVTYCLDFQAPFSVIQAMCIALSCVL